MPVGHGGIYSGFYRYAKQYAPYIARTRTTPADAVRSSSGGEIPPVGFIVHAVLCTQGGVSRV